MLLSEKDVCWVDCLKCEEEESKRGVEHGPHEVPVRRPTDAAQAGGEDGDHCRKQADGQHLGRVAELVRMLPHVKAEACIGEKAANRQRKLHTQGHINGPKLVVKARQGAGQLVPCRWGSTP